MLTQEKAYNRGQHQSLYSNETSVQIRAFLDNQMTLERLLYYYIYKRGFNVSAMRVLSIFSDNIRLIDHFLHANFSKT